MAAALSSACSGPQFKEDPRAVPIVELKAVLNSLKCGLATALVDDRHGRAGLQGAVAQVKLDVNVVQGVDAKGDIKAGIPVSGGTVTPSLTLAFSEVRSVNSSIDIDLALRAKDASICTAAQDSLGRDAGFSTWIQGVVAQIYEVEPGDPKASLKLYVYESNFTVKRSGQFGLAAEIVPVKLTSSFGSSRDDIQKMKVTIVPVRFVKDKNGNTRAVVGGRPFFVAPRTLQEPETKNRRGNFLLE